LVRREKLRQQAGSYRGAGQALSARKFLLL
jgi:hypothetical protein